MGYISRIYPLIFLFLGVFLILFFASRGYFLSKNLDYLESGSINIVSDFPLRIVSSPVKIKIPKIGIEANIESVGLDGFGRMDVPQNVLDIAWYNLGVKPGEKGNAVFAGHFDKPDGSPAVFFKLDSLEKGDRIDILDQNGKTQEFIVTEKRVVSTDKFPLQEVFGETDQVRVNLITCGGEWNKEKKEYSERTIIFAEIKTF